VGCLDEEGLGLVLSLSLVPSLGLGLGLGLSDPECSEGSDVPGTELART